LRSQERLAGIEAGITHPNIKPNGPPILAPSYQAMAWRGMAPKYGDFERSQHQD